MLTVQIEQEFNKDYFNECFDSSLPYVRENLNWQDWDTEDERGRLWIMARYVKAFEAEDEVVFSIKKGDHILGYCLGIVDHELDSLQLEYILYNTDETGSRSWIYTEYYKSNALQDMLASIGLRRWHNKVYAENGEKTSLHSGVPDGDRDFEYGNRTRNYRLFKSPYGWDD